MNVTHSDCFVLFQFHEDPWSSEDKSLDSNYTQVTDLRKKFPHLKVSIAKKFPHSHRKIRNLCGKIRNLCGKICNIYSIESFEKIINTSKLETIIFGYVLLQVLAGILRNNREYIAIANSDYNLQYYVKNIANFLEKHDLDGVDLRWDYSSDG